MSVRLHKMKFRCVVASSACLASLDMALGECDGSPCQLLSASRPSRLRNFWDQMFPEDSETTVRVDQTVAEHFKLVGSIETCTTQMCDTNDNGTDDEDDHIDNLRKVVKDIMATFASNAPFEVQEDEAPTGENLTNRVFTRSRVNTDMALAQLRADIIAASFDFMWTLAGTNDPSDTQGKSYWASSEVPDTEIENPEQVVSEFQEFLLTNVFSALPRIPGGGDIFDRDLRTQLRLSAVNNQRVVDRCKQAELDGETLSFCPHIFVQYFDKVSGSFLKNEFENFDADQDGQPDRGVDVDGDDVIDSWAEWKDKIKRRWFHEAHLGDKEV